LYCLSELVHSDGNKEWCTKSKSVPFNPRANPMWHESVKWVLPKGDELAFVRYVFQRLQCLIILIIRFASASSSCARNGAMTSTLDSLPLGCRG